MVMPDQLNCTHQGCTFEFQCLQPLFKVVGESALKNETVICGKKGKWMFNNLTCVGKYVCSVLILGCSVVTSRVSNGIIC